MTTAVRLSGRWVGRFVAVVALMGAGLVAPGLPASGTPPQTTVRTLVADAWQETRIGGSAVTRESAPIPAGDAVLVGADWGGGEDVAVQVRARRDGRWGPWQDLHLPHDHGPDPGSDEATRDQPSASDPVYVGRADDLQVRVSGAPPSSVRLHAVGVSGGDGLAYTPPDARGGSARAATTPPGIISRASWGADESLRRDHPARAPELRFAVVHHTAGSNSYGPSESDDIVRAIYAYHVNVRGWDDIGYNFLVDRFGRVFEGRAGGVTAAVVGAHAAGWNWASTGVAVMGNFVSEAPPSDAVAALDRLLAWKLDQHHVDPHGTTLEVAGGGATNRYERGTRVELPTVIGHRTTNNTACPGDRLFASLYDGGRRVVADRLDGIGMPKAYGGPLPVREQAVTGTRPRWDVDFTHPLDWELAITGPDGEMVRSTSGSGQQVQLEWDLYDGDGSSAGLVPPGEYLARLTGQGDGGTITPVETRLHLTAPVDRYGGLERIETSVRLSRWAFDHSHRAVLATAAAFPDALVASPLAASLDAPVLLVPPEGLPDMVAAELERLGTDEVYVVGGTERIPTAVEDELVERAGIARESIHRLAGPTRFDTAAAIARTVLEREGSGEVLLALGQHADPLRAFPDALTAGGFGAARGLPVLLVQPDVLPDPSAEVLRAAAPVDGLVVVSTGDAVTPGVQQEAAGAAGGAPVTRFEGPGRFATGRLMAEELLRRRQADVERDGADPHAEPTGLEVVLATGDNWPDALAAAAAAAERAASFLLVPTGSLDDGPAARRWLTDHAASLARAVLSGGPVAISEPVEQEVSEIVQSAGPQREPRATWGGPAAALPGLPWLSRRGG